MSMGCITATIIMNLLKDVVAPPHCSWPKFVQVSNVNFVYASRLTDIENMCSDYMGVSTCSNMSMSLGNNVVGT